MRERILFHPRLAALNKLLGLLHIRGGAEPRQPELQAPVGTYEFFETTLAQYSDPLEQVGRKLHSLERDGTYLDVSRGRYQEGKTPRMHVTVCQPLEEKFCNAIYSMDITPDDRIELSANLNMAGELKGLPKPEANLDEVLQTARFVLDHPAILMG